MDDISRVRPRTGTRPAAPRQGARPQERGRPASAAPRTPPGLTAPGAVVVSSVVLLFFALLSELFTDKLGLLFGLPFLAVCVLVPARTRVRDLLIATISPALAFGVTVFTVSILFPERKGGGALARTALNLLTLMSQKAGLLWFGTGLAAVIAFTRFRRSRAAQPPSQSRRRPSARR